MRNKGQILGEVVVAIGVIMLVLIGMSSLMSRNTKTIRQGNVKDEAFGMVQTQISYYKGLRDQDVTGFFASLPPQRDTFLPCTWSQPTPSTDLVPISCQIMYTDVGAGDGVTITVKGVWTEETANDRDVSLTASIMKI